jgi:hypothetical protein
MAKRKPKANSVGRRGGRKPEVGRPASPGPAPLRLAAARLKGRHASVFTRDTLFSLSDEVACPLKREAVNNLVLSAVQRAHPSKLVRSTSRPVEDLGADDFMRRLYFPKIAAAMSEHGCLLEGIGPGDMLDCATVTDIAEKIWKARQ